MFTIVAGLPELMEQDRNQVAGYVDMAFASHVDCPFLDIFLADFHKTHQRITFSTTVSSSHAAAEAVRNNEAAVGIFLTREKLEELEYTLLYREHFGFFCGPTHPLFEQRIEGFDALRTLDYVSFRTDDVSGALAPIADLRRREQLRGQIVGRFTNLEEVKRLIKAGFGFGPLPIHVVVPRSRPGNYGNCRRTKTRLRLTSTSSRNATPGARARSLYLSTRCWRRSMRLRLKSGHIPNPPYTGSEQDLCRIVR
ncbi:MAG: substrate-binding domain-containing protein [Fimbriimonadaceae bacterium]|nr:substrate-binding domain-containing protein [Alphaproteobacteria bacterium]